MRIELQAEASGDRIPGIDGPVDDEPKGGLPGSTGGSAPTTPRRGLVSSASLAPWWEGGSAGGYRTRRKGAAQLTVGLAGHPRARHGNRQQLTERLMPVRAPLNAQCGHNAAGDRVVDMPNHGNGGPRHHARHRDGRRDPDLRLSKCQPSSDRVPGCHVPAHGEPERWAFRKGKQPTHALTTVQCTFRV
jgi:hypothetical protein